MTHGPGDSVSRRRVLGLAAGATFGSVAVGSVASEPDGTVRLNVGYSDPGGKRAARDVADEVVYEFGFDAVTIRAPARARETLADRPDVRYAERDGKMRAIDVGGGSTCATGDQPLTWGIDRVDADVAHENCATGDGADIAIIDTGIDRFHSDLDVHLGEGVAFVAGVRTSNWQDDNGHGTHVAGIAGALDSDRGVVGIAPGASLHGVKVMQSVGVGFTSDVARGIEWTAEQGYDVGNMSLGGADSDLLREACAAAEANGVLLVAAAGNSGPCEDCVSYPAAYDSVVAVSATACDDALAGFSSTGQEVDLAAPGKDIYSTYTGSTPATNTYATLSGTSMASPHVAGAGAQLMATGDDNEEARSTLVETAEDLGMTSNDQGAGLVDVAAALGLDSSDDGTGNGPNC